MDEPFRFLTDEDFDNRIRRGLLARYPSLDLLRAQDVGLTDLEDVLVLEWAAREQRIVLTHDASTMEPAAWARIEAGLPMPGIMIIGQSVAIGVAVENLVLIVESSDPEEWTERVTHLPL
jgi:hypothetical protein